MLTHTCTAPIAICITICTRYTTIHNQNGSQVNQVSCTGLRKGSNPSKLQERADKTSLPSSESISESKVDRMDRNVLMARCACRRFKPSSF